MTTSPWCCPVCRASGDIPVLQTVLQQATAAVRRFSDPAWRPEGLVQLAAALRGLLESAEPGTDHQLTFAHALASVATAPGDLALLSGLLDGTASVGGLAVDTELRWRCCTGWPAGARPGRTRSTPSWTGTGPTPASATRPPAGPRSRTRPARRKPGSRSPAAS